MPSILALLAKPKPGADEDMEPEEGPETTYAREAFSALKDDDEQGFVDAFLSAVRACSKKSKAGGYEDDADDDL